MLLFVYTTTRKGFVIFTCRYFKLSWNTTPLSQSNCRNFSYSSINIEREIMLTVKATICLVTNLFPANMTSKASFILSRGIVWVMSFSRLNFPAMNSCDNLGIISRATHPCKQNKQTKKDRKVKTFYYSRVRGLYWRKVQRWGKMGNGIYLFLYRENEIYCTGAGI